MDHYSWIQPIFAFAVVLALMAGLGLLLRYLSSKGFMLGVKNFRDRRMAIVESLPIDGKRRCVILKCDGHEHLLLLGGQNDIVIETNLTPSKTQNPQNPS